MNTPDSHISFKARAIAIALTTVVTTIVVFWFGTAVVKRITHVDNIWKEYNDHAGFVSDKLYQIESNFGYGGFIHNYKNYVLRQDMSRASLISSELKDTYRAIDEYLAHISTSDEEREALIDFRHVVDQYADNFKLATQLISEGRSSKEIDEKVRVDDRPALNALKLLSQHQVIHRHEIKERTSQALLNTFNFAYWGVLLIPLILLIGIAMILSIKRIMTSNELLSETHQYLDDLFEATPDAMLIVDKGGEIVRSNIEAVKLLGYSKEELNNFKVEDLMPDRYRGMHTGIRTGTFEQPVSRPLKTDKDFFALTKDGRELPIEISLSFTHRGTNQLAITTMRDVSDRKEAEAKLRNSEEILNKAQEIAHIGSWDWHLEQKTLHWSDEIYRIFGLERGEFTDTYAAFMNSVHPDDRELVNKSVEAAIAENKSYNIQHRIVRPDGEERVVMEQAKVFRNEWGVPYRMVGTVQDVSDRIQADEKIKLASKVFDSTLEAILIMDKETRITEVNDGFCALFGYNRDELQGQLISMLNSGGRHKDDFIKIQQDLVSTDFWQGEIWNRRKDGALSPCMASISAVKDITGKISHYVAVFLDISAIKQNQTQLEKLAHFDQLTGLANRFLFNDRLRASLKRANRNKKEMAIMYIDLDGFKAVNDILGHESGDEVLMKTARNINLCVREDDTVARFGGDEFVIILNDQHDHSQLEIIAQRIIKALNMTVENETENLKVSASIGIAIYPTDTTEEETLLGYADQAMYHAKNHGKNNYCFFNSI